jgi:hypothetical protein
MSELQFTEKDGYVAFFDILGYGEIDNCTEVLRILRETHEKIKKMLEKAERDLTSASCSCEHFLFGDSIILFFGGKPQNCWPYVALFCQQIFRGLWDKGIALRGAIAKGVWYRDRIAECYGYAGKPIVEAHRYAEILDFAGCVLTPSAEDLTEIPVNFAIEVGAEPLCFSQREVQIKQIGKQKLFLLLPKGPITRDDVRKRFQSFNRRIGSATLSKFNNTVALMSSEGASKPPPEMR